MFLWGPCPWCQVGKVGAGFQQDQLSHGTDPLVCDLTHDKRP